MEQVEQLEGPLEAVGFSDLDGTEYSHTARPRHDQGKSAVPEGIPQISWPRVAIGAAGFLFLTLAVFWNQFANIQAGSELFQWKQLRWDYFLLILLCLPLDTLSSGLRIWLVSGVLKPEISFCTCLKAEWANLGVSMLTPSQTGGGFGQMYILYRGGASLSTALSISLISFIGTMVGLLCIGLYALLFSGVDQLGRVFAGAVWIFTIISAFMVLAAVWPGLVSMFIKRSAIIISSMLKKARIYPKAWAMHSRTGDGKEIDTIPHAKKLIECVTRYSADVRMFVRLGKTRFLCVCSLSLVFLFSRAFMAFLCLRFVGIELSTLSQVLETQLVLNFLIYFAPTPGGSGIAEGASLGMMAQIVPMGVAPYYHLLWRSTTLFLPACVGLFVLFQTIMQDTQRVLTSHHAAGGRKTAYPHAYKIKQESVRRWGREPE